MQTPFLALQYPLAKFIAKCYIPVQFLINVAAPQTQNSEGWGKKFLGAEVGTCPASACSSPWCHPPQALQWETAFHGNIADFSCLNLTGLESTSLLLLLKGFLLKSKHLTSNYSFSLLGSYTDCITGYNSGLSKDLLWDASSRIYSGYHLKYRPCCFDSQERRNCHWKLILL